MYYVYGDLFYSSNEFEEGEIKGNEVNTLEIIDSSIKFISFFLYFLFNDKRLKLQIDVIINNNDFRFNVYNINGDINFLRFNIEKVDNKFFLKVSNISSNKVFFYKKIMNIL